MSGYGLIDVAKICGRHFKILIKNNFITERFELLHATEFVSGLLGSCCCPDPGINWNDTAVSPLRLIIVKLRNCWGLCSWSMQSHSLWFEVSFFFIRISEPLAFVSMEIKKFHFHYFLSSWQQISLYAKIALYCLNRAALEIRCSKIKSKFCRLRDSVTKKW